MQNTPGSRDSPVINTLGSLDSLVYYSPESFFEKLFLCLFKVHKEVDSSVHHRGVQTPLCIHHQGVDTPWCIHHRGVETRQCIHHRGVNWTPGSHFMDFKEHITIFKGSIIQKIDYRLL